MEERRRIRKNYVINKKDERRGGKDVNEVWRGFYNEYWGKNRKNRRDRNEEVRKKVKVRYGRG